MFKSIGVRESSVVVPLYHLELRLMSGRSAEAGRLSEER